ncbi:MAG: hypothetical protein AB1714_21245 [Acidobacteriota bacterium]
MSNESADRAVLLARLEEIAEELIAIRSALLVSEDAAPQGDISFTEQLHGCMGEEPLARYDYSLDWRRFDR